jgi:hypothetical protein
LGTMRIQVARDWQSKSECLFKSCRDGESLSSWVALCERVEWKYGEWEWIRQQKKEVSWLKDAQLVRKLRPMTGLMQVEW